MTTSQTLMEMYEAMLEQFGHQGWWPGDGPLEICIGAVLTQNTNWANVEKALVNLRVAGAMSVSAIHEMDHDALAQLIRPAGYFNIKAKRLKNLIAHVYEAYGDDIEAFLDRSVWTLHEELMPINGIGRETADSIILYAAEKPTFVIDRYTCRIMVRHGLICPEDDYEQVKDLFESSLAEDLDIWKDYHAQIVAVGKQYCRPKAKCDGCPLEQFPHDMIDQ
ncbi:MAG: endonuclease III domain-containing protein [Phycisphaerae bacterium]|nr:endonuclease III domain-containing protein [Phycisphaerae bacterium]MDP7287947.1 endonuclease III domain-containing protein [Phycisphaerae bacterium]